MNMSCQ